MLLCLQRRLLAPHSTFLWEQCIATCLDPQTLTTARVQCPFDDFRCRIWTKHLSGPVQVWSPQPVAYCWLMELSASVTLKGFPGQGPTVYLHCPSARPRWAFHCAGSRELTSQREFSAARSRVRAWVVILRPNCYPVLSSRAYLNKLWLSGSDCGLRHRTELLFHPALPVANSVILMLLFTSLGFLCQVRMIAIVPTLLGFVTEFQ